MRAGLIRYRNELTPNLNPRVCNGFTSVDIENGDVKCQWNTLLLFDNVLADVLARHIYIFKLVILSLQNTAVSTYSMGPRSLLG